MKKFLGIVFLALLWCNITFAKIIELDQGVKIKIPDGYEYVQFKRLEFFRGKAGEWGELSKSQFDNYIDEQQTPAHECCCNVIISITYSWQTHSLYFMYISVVMR